MNAEAEFRGTEIAGRPARREAAGTRHRGDDERLGEAVIPHAVLDGERGRRRIAQVRQNCVCPKTATAGR